MKLTPEQLTQAKAAKSADELLALAKENGVELTGDEAATYFADLHKGGEIADDELGNVSGGCGDDDKGISDADTNAIIPIVFSEPDNMDTDKR